MEPASIPGLNLARAWSDGDPTLQTRDGHLLHWQDGTMASSVVQFEVDPGCHIGRHRHSAEEVMLVLEGEVELAVAEREPVSLRANELWFVHPGVAHDVRCVSEGTARCIGFFAAASVVSVYEDVLQPDGTRVRGTPLPDD
jgi:quercetin dioxygenase-like cupin family protein